MADKTLASTVALDKMFRVRVRNAAKVHIVQNVAQNQGRQWRGALANGVTWLVKEGDAFEALQDIERNSIHCTITSPPYFWLRDYGVLGQIGLEDSVSGYVAAITHVMSQVFEVLRPDGLLFLNLGDTYYSGRGKSHGEDRKSTKRRFGLRAVDKGGGLGIGLQRKSAIGIPWRVAEEMCERGWILRSSIIWHREKCLPEAVKDRPRRSYEFVFMFAKSRYYYFNRQPLIDKDFDEDVWTIAARPKGNGSIDTAPYPDELVERCIDIGCRKNGIVLDPFAGSGTTLRVALRKDRSAIGIELNPQFCKHIVTELANELL
jgi:DNA modification methylase